MIAAVASCPNPPLLLPGATGGEVAEVEQLRAACLAAVAVLTARSVPIVIIGAAQQQDEPDGALSIGVGRALLDQAGVDAPVMDEVLAADLPPAECVLLGEQLAADERQLALLVMADGSARRTEKAPGYFDERAEAFDAVIEAALRAADAPALADLSPQLATELLAAGRPAWQVLAAAVTASGPEISWTVRSHYFGAPFGVFYPVVNWLPESADGQGSEGEGTK